MSGLRAHLRLACSVGVVGGVVFGCREALDAVEANGFVQPGQYLWVYAAVPVLAWLVVGVLLMVPVGLTVGARRRGRAASESLPLYSVALVFAGTFSVTTLWRETIASRLSEVGVSIGLGLHVLMWTLAIGLAGVAAALAGAAAAWYAARTQRPLRYLTPIALVIATVLLVPVIRFFATDWRWGFAVPDATTSAGPKPNVLLISIDTLRADHLGSYGDPHGLTPRLDGLAAEGVLFERAITSSPWTLPAMASVLTGATPHRHGAGAITNRRDPLGRSALPPGSWTLANALRERGYRTHAIVTNPYLALRYGVGQGFDSYENVTIESEAFLAFGHTTAVRLLTWLRPELVIGDRGDTVSRRAERWLGGVGSQPFFLWVHYIDPHPPYSRAGATQHKSFRSDSLFAPPGGDEPIRLTSPDVARLRSGEVRLSAAQKEAVRGLYRDEVASVDAAVGVVLDTLDRLGLRDRTLVVCLADHGEEFWEHGGVEHGHTVYDELIHVPLLLRWPGHLPPGTRVHPISRLIDTAPTILDALNLPTPSGLEGASLLPLLRGDETAPRLALSENLLFAEERVGLRTPTQKYIQWENGKEEVYDLTTDPRERVDLAGIAAAIEPLRRLYAEVDHQEGPATAATTAPDGAGEAALRALGYLR